MPKYSVLVPCTAAISVEIEADNEEAARDAALYSDFQVSVTGDAELFEFEAHEQIVKGNVFCGVLNSVDVKLLED